MKIVSSFFCLIGLCGVLSAQTMTMQFVSDDRSTDKMHTVAQGENLYRISKAYGLKIDDVKNYNQLTSDAIKIGQILKIPQTSGLRMLTEKPTNSPVVAPVATTQATISANTTLKEGATFYYTTAWKPYTVEAGESLETIASKLNVSVGELQSWNDGVTNDRLHVGDNLKVSPEQVPVYLNVPAKTPEPIVETPAVNVGTSTMAVVAPTISTPTGVGTVSPTLQRTVDEIPAISVAPVVVEQPSTPTISNLNPAPIVIDMPHVIAAENLVTPEVNLGNQSETGTFFVVENKALSDKYYIYHKTLPMGTKVKIHIPNNGGYLEAKVVARTRADRAEIVGVCPTIKRILGVAPSTPIKISY